MKEKEHIHTYDKNGKRTCCSLEEKIDRESGPPDLVKEKRNSGHKHDHDHSPDGHNHDHGDSSELKTYFPAIISLILLLSGLAFEHLLRAPFFTGWVKIGWYLAAYLPVALPVLKEAFAALRQGEVFTEFFLMGIATVGAFAIGEYPEGVAVMLFYAVGELFQAAAVKRSKNNIKALLDVRPKIASVLRNGKYEEVNPETVEIGDTIQIKVGEKIPLDGVLLSTKTSLNTSALTGESKPQSVLQGERVLAGSINLESVAEVKVTSLFNDSSIARILDLVQNATSRKSKTELLIRRLAKIYTPIVVYLALAICFLPYFFVEDYAFSTWLYRALIFLVISCPCALVISIPLGYFGGLGAASKQGILFKGATYLEQITKLTTLVMDKTGTVTKGVFTIKDIKISADISESEFMKYLLSIESKSTHPIAKALLEYDLQGDFPEAQDLKEVAGKGIIGNVNGKTVAAGNAKLMQEIGVTFPKDVHEIVDSIVLVAINEQFAGYVTIADELKEDTHATIEQLKAAGISEFVMLSGDKDTITQQVAAELSIQRAKGGLLPEDKLNELMTIKADKTKVVGFVGDGINDAPVLAASDIGIAMGAMGSDVAIETADVIIQTDQPSKIATGIKIGKATQRIIWQNITIAFAVKAVVLVLGAIGLATMWAAVFADVGVALLAILNAVRIQKMEW